MKVLITGIEGFVAPYLADLFNEEEVYGTYFLKPEKKEGINYSKLDITDKDEVNNFIGEIKPDVIFHLAGFSSVAESWKKPELAMKINAEGAKNILDAVREANISPKIVIITSSDIYGKPKKLPITENHPLEPMNPYGESRLEEEKIVEEYKDLNITVARSFSHTGPGQPPKFVIPAFAHQVAMIEKGKQEPVIRHGNLNVKRDFTDVRDVVKAYKLLSEKGKSHTAYNVCSGKSLLLSELLKTLISMSSVEIKDEIDPERMRPADIPEQRGSNEKIHKDTGWKPEIDFKDTVKDILDYWRNKA